MRWKSGRRSKNVEDRREKSSGFGLPSSGRGRLPIKGGGKLGLVGIIVIVAFTYFTGGDLSSLLQSGGALDGVIGGGQTSAQRNPTPSKGIDAGDDNLAQFVAVTVGYTEDVWHQIFKTQIGGTYSEPKLVLFSGRVRSACGMASAATGPFYCPADRQVYIDLSFYQDLKNKMGAPGDFAQAYVIAHEVGHHVQTLLGISKKVHAQKRSVSKAAGNKLSVKQELQADCFAGLWANIANKQHQIIEGGDIDEALGAAAAVGDDRLQKQSQGYVVPESFTHGTSAQRIMWFKRGFQSGDINQCNTFS